jgi:hypothetical protein
MLSEKTQWCPSFSNNGGYWVAHGVAHGRGCGQAEPGRLNIGQHGAIWPSESRCGGITDMTEEKPAGLADDLLIGAEAIAAFLGVDVQTVYSFRRTKKKLPIGKLGKNLIASKRKLERAMGTLTSGEKL